MYGIETGILNPSKDYFHTPTAMAKSLLFYSEICGHFYTNHDYRIRRYDFGNFLLLHVLDGTMHVEIPDETLTVSAGEAVLIDCHAPHEYHTVKNCEFEFVHFEGSNSRDLYTFIIQSRGAVFPVEERSTIPYYLHQLIEMSVSDRLISEIAMSQALYAMLSDIISTSQHETLSGGKSDIIQNALLFIREHLTEQITLEDIASHAGVSVYHFSRLFKKATGSSPHEYIILSRIDRAKILLRTTTLPVAEIAFQVGYTSDTSFITSFTGRVGMSPGKFRTMFGAA